MRTGPAVAATATVAATILSVTLPATAAPAASHETYFAQAGRSEAPAYEPKNLLLSGDSSIVLQVDHYKKWTTTRAAGSGTYDIDKCKKSCASGPVKKYPVTFVIKDPAKDCHKEFFGRLVVTYTGKRPNGAPQTFRQNVAPERGCT